MLIVIVSIIGAAAVVGAIYVGTQSFDGIVVEHPYEHGLDWDRVRHLKAELGWSVEMKEMRWIEGQDRLAFRVIDKGGTPLRDVSVVLRVSRPATARYDIVYKDIPVQDGWFAADVNIALPGLWDLWFTVARGEKAVEIRKRIFAEEK